MAARVAKQAARASGTAALCRLMELPEELLLRALEYLDMAALQAAGSACAALRRLGASPELVEAAARESGEFWAPLAFEEPARSRIQHLLPRAAEGGPPTIGALRLFFSGTQPCKRPDPSLFFYVTVEGEGDVLATFGPMDADAVVDTKANVSVSSYHSALLRVSLDWKNATVKKEYSASWSSTPLEYLNYPTGDWLIGTLVKKSVAIFFYAVTKSGTYLVNETPMLRQQFTDWHEYFNKPRGNGADAMVSRTMRTATLAFPLPPECGFQATRKAEGQQRKAVLSQLKSHFRPTLANK
jgi:hypothetical protein